ncbi:MAG: septum formation initiator family protein [Chitinispirillales bacterium]|jgi:cell division protein FtsB|nr:septum formation initiator family protein [Chitinispirillales bacterium]
MKKSKKIIFIAASVIAVTAIVLMTVGDRGFLDMYRLHREEKSRIREVAAARAEIDSLKAEIERLRNDTAYIERVARERLGMARKGEMIFKFVEENDF